MQVNMIFSVRFAMISLDMISNVRSVVSGPLPGYRLWVGFLYSTRTQILLTLPTACTPIGYGNVGDLQVIRALRPYTSFTVSGQFWTLLVIVRGHLFATE